ncbi:hypothetical protein BI308_23115 [Roseofilum reptotaenium AO1-A]|uniref:Uncharacterized protein n=1 Tax=Roseofilum reptotaenium AO1-A TaxID=1925591 RepID=A0A1L9QKK8_9CYAN|nr:hypothetical protein BI308_23115 [Roseofilum reptotaenium AO1-A]
MLTSDEINHILELCPHLEASEEFQRKNPAPEDRIEWGDEVETIQKQDEIISVLLKQIANGDTAPFLAEAKEKLGFAIGSKGEDWETIAQRLLNLALEKTNACQELYESVPHCLEVTEEFDQTLHRGLTDVFLLRRHLRQMVAEMMVCPRIRPCLNPPLFEDS